jgi:3-phenylpropionate/trans-cinnamate dioxygenase ferredoxin component
VECPWHGSKFDVRTGNPTNLPAWQPVPSCEVKIEGSDILLKNPLITNNPSVGDRNQD